MKKLEDYLYYEEKNPDLKIYCGDCLEILPLLPKVDLVVTDPPYGIGYDKQQNKMAKSGRISNGGKWKQYDETDWDKSVPSDEVISLVISKAKDSIIWGGNYFNLPAKSKWLIWNKVQRSFMTDGEMAWTTFKGQVSIFDMARTDAYINSGMKKEHPTQKPIELIRWSIQQCKYWDKALSILDPFMGSGTTLVACKELNRNGIGIEISEKYCAIAKQRLKATTKSLF
jgi:DNA modification methylase